MFVSLKFIVSFAVQMYNKSNIMQKEVNKSETNELRKQKKKKFLSFVNV